MANKVEELWLLGGVTSSGKTEVSLDWAEKNNAEILSCDSVSFYRGLDVGSAKPDGTERKRVVHHGLDLAEVRQVYDVGQFHSYARKVVDDISSRGKKVLVVGGSGFFIHGFLRAVVDGVEVSDEVRTKVQSLFDDGGIEAVSSELKKSNPNGLGGLDIKNPVRVMRALERCIESGRSLLDLQEEFKNMPRPYPNFQKKMIWLNRNDDDLIERINLRTVKMIEGGMIEETAEAIKNGIGRHPSLSESVGYRQVIEYLSKGGEIKDLICSISQSTRQLVAKQRKWFRKHFPAGSCLEISRKQSVDIGHMNWMAET